MRRFGLLSLVLHAALLGGLLVWFSRTPKIGDLSDTKGAVELMLVEQPTIVAAAAQPQHTEPQPPEPDAPVPPPAVTAEDVLSLPPPPSPPPPKPVRAEQPTAQHAKEPLQVSINGTDSDTFAVATGALVVPASVDAKFHNRQPAYPPEAVRRAEQGAVLLLIHVSPEGLPVAVDVAQSSGFAQLDRAARDAVLGWHFLPAVRDGRAIPFDMTMRVVFHLD